ncbi:MAG: ABC transporter substrate-binding protein, partial [Oligoflexia bacterium]|nr:ABC transporter substrate-binding protein [Oligoflexia bacterium]
MAELSGPSAANGQLCRQGVDAARRLLAPNDKIGSYSVRFAFGDTQGQGPAGISEFLRLVQAEQAVVVVTTRSQVGMAVNPVSEEKGVPLFGIVGHSDFLKTNRYAYRFWPTAESEGDAIAKKLKSDGVSRVAILTTEDQWTRSLTDNFSAEFSRLDGDVALSASVDPSDVDFSTLIARIRASNAQAILLNMTLAHMGIAIKRAREAGLQQKLYANYWVNNPATIEVAGSAVKGVVYDEPNP